MVEAAAGRRTGTSRRRPSGSGGEHRHLVALAVAARVAMVTTRSVGPAAVAEGDGAGAAVTDAGAAGGGGRCMEDFFDCLLGLLGALGMTWAAARPQRQPRPPLPRGAAGAGPAPTDSRRFAAELRATPGRIAGNGACAVASLYTLQGKKGVNQDAMIFWEVKGKLKGENKEPYFPCFLVCAFPQTSSVVRFLMYFFPTVLDQI
jgi:hypothetical protein